MNVRTFLHAVSLEMRTLLSYRFDFWMNFVLSTLTFTIANYYLWVAVYRARGVSEIAGYTLPDMVLYALLTGCLMRVVFAGMRLTVANDIYSGGLNRYLVFPVSFQGFKYAGHLAYGLVSLAQLALALGAGRLLLGAEPFARMSPGLFAVGVVASLAAGSVYFVLGAILEMVAFWADNVWSLGVLLRFVTLFLGGGIAPLALFPESALAVLRWTPFPYVLSFPIRCLQGSATWAEVSMAIPLLVGWGLVIAAGGAQVYRRGLRTYTGVGI
jgi:ABC-2 type transport system permease protein